MFEIAHSEYEKNAFNVMDDLLIAAGHTLAQVLDEIFSLKN